jgi:hypothetical protein
MFRKTLQLPSSGWISVEGKESCYIDLATAVEWRDWAKWGAGYNRMGKPSVWIESRMRTLMRRWNTSCSECPPILLTYSLYPMQKILCIVMCFQECANLCISKYVTGSLSLSMDGCDSIFMWCHGHDKLFMYCGCCPLFMCFHEYEFELY